MFHVVITSLSLPGISGRARLYQEKESCMYC